MHDQQKGTREGDSVLRQAVEACEAGLGDRLRAAYALGSLVHGGFSALVSDVDLGLVLADPIQDSDDERIRVLAHTVRAGGTVLHERLSVFWGTPSTLRGLSPGGRFPPLDRLDLLENGRLLQGLDVRAGMARPDRTELLVVGAEFALDYLGGGRGISEAHSSQLGSMSPGDDSVLEELRTPKVLVSRGPRRLTKLVLFPVRFLFTAATGQVGTNAVAVTHYVTNDQAPARELVGAALSWRLSPPEDVDGAAALLEQQLIPLYLHYIDDHISRLIAAGRADLASSFERWRLRLVA